MHTYENLNGIGVKRGYRNARLGGSLALPCDGLNGERVFCYNAGVDARTRESVRPIAIVDPRTPGLASLNARRPNQTWQRNARSDKSVGNSIDHSLQIKVERRSNKGVTILTAYTWSKSISGPNDIGGQVGGGNFIGAPQNIYDLRSERAVSGFDVTQRYVQTLLYELPFFKGATGVKRALLGGWQVSTIVTAQSGFPTPVTVAQDTTGIGANSRPNWVSGQSGNLAAGDRTWKRWFNTGAFTEPVFGAFGTSPRTAAFRLPGVLNADFSLNKTFKLTEARGLEFRTEAFNLFNHYNPDPAAVDRNTARRRTDRLAEACRA